MERSEDKWIFKGAKYSWGVVFRK
ncbi:hypothetical protein C5167_032227 [Papaver somniferum]|uniref:Uncharacterized protein n=1 Tax=Papaver somniferum TaxID=3469 RepID=A0A4Y7K9V7_PAPSO|nr:hypothetical protein C5167_032227 [Papaver somniferum]